MNKIITRFPPSPTGHLHIGGARTALFNWFYARHMKGRFILRIEDTDRARSTSEFVDSILKSLEWLGLDWDEGPYFQSQRFDIYASFINKLIASNKAYYCTCSSEKLEEMRKKARALGEKPKYDQTCRGKDLKAADNAVIRFKAPITGTTVLQDSIKGNITFQNSELDDFIIQRSDGTPTYNFVVVVDDISMGINTVIRGDDHINNSPRQIALYNALDAPLPTFGHVPMVLGKDRARLSKRHGAQSVMAYQDMGYLPDALVNYLMRLGWSYGDQEFFSGPELIEKFTLKNIGTSPGIFNPEKLISLNAKHIKTASSKSLASRLIPYLKEKGCDKAEEGPFLESVIETLKSRSKTLLEMGDGALFYYKEEITYDKKAADKFFTSNSIEIISNLIEKLENIDDFEEKGLENIFKAVMEEKDIKLGKIAQPLRVALTGKSVSPGIFEIIMILGKEKTIARLKAAVKFINLSV